jgi:TetR/AcrR family transcriptional repressor of nem operon
VKEIVDTAGVPKGSFYSYFDSKEALVVEVIQRYWDAVEARHGALLEDEAAPPLERISTFFAAMADDHELLKFTQGCLLGSMALELSNSSPATRTTLTGLFDRWETRIAATLALAQERGDLARDRNVHELAAAALEAWEGRRCAGRSSGIARPTSASRGSRCLDSSGTPLITRRPVGYNLGSSSTHLEGTLMTLPLEHAALLFIDPQIDFLDPASVVWDVVGEEVERVGVLANLVRLRRPPCAPAFRSSTRRTPIPTTSTATGATKYNKTTNKNLKK